MKYLGWHAYSNTGQPHRRWCLDDAECKKLGAPTAVALYDDGPGAPDDQRFQIRNTAGDRLRDLTLEEATGLFVSGRLPDWNPPADPGLRGEVLSAINRLSAAVRSIEALARTEAILRQARVAAEKEESAPRQENRFLRMVREGTYSGGQEYRDWEFLADAPGVLAYSSADPAHAIKGDVLREEPDDHLSPFELRRNGRQIGAPEWWQLSGLFVGLRTSRSEDEDATEPSEEPATEPAEDEALLAFKALRLDWGGSVGGTVIRAPLNLPDTGLRAGDLLWMGHDHGGLAEACGIVRQIQREHYEAIACAISEPGARIVAATHNRASVEGFARSLRMSARSRKAKPESAPLHLLRPFSRERPVPLKASSDDGALFELLASVGCRMPA